MRWLQWTQGRDTDYSDADLLPIVTFGEHCSFADLGLRHLRAAGVRHEVVLEVISCEGMRDALASGVGVALWNVSELDERHVRCDLDVRGFTTPRSLSLPLPLPRSAPSRGRRSGP